MPTASYEELLIETLPRLVSFCRETHKSLIH